MDVESKNYRGAGPAPGSEEWVGKNREKSFLKVVAKAKRSFWKQVQACSSCDGRRTVAPTIEEGSRKKDLGVSDSVNSELPAARPLAARPSVKKRLSSQRLSI